MIKSPRVAGLLLPIGFVTTLLVFVQGRALADAANKVETRIRVRLEVTAEPTTKRLVTDFFSRKLRTLGTAELVETAPDYVWSILAVRPKTTGGYQTGCVLSVVVLRRYQNKEAAGPRHQESKPSEQTGERDAYDTYQHLLKIGPSGGLEVLCEEIVDGFQRQWLGGR